MTERLLRARLLVRIGAEVILHMRAPAPRIISAIAVCSSWAAATTVEPMPVARLADHAAVVCDAVVESVQSRWSEDPIEIVSDVRFASVSYWKGNPSPTAAIPATLTMTVPGGTIGTMTMRIAGAPEFTPGQRWVLFVLPEYRVFPVVGLWEGAFRVQRDSQGVDRVLDAGGRAITGIDAAGFIQTPPANGAPVVHQGCAHAEGVRLTTPSVTASSEVALSLAEFRTLLARTLAASRAHSGGTVAGRRIATRLMSVPLVPAAAGAANGREARAIRSLPSAPEAAARTIGARESRQTSQPKK